MKSGSSPNSPMSWGGNETRLPEKWSYCFDFLRIVFAQSIIPGLKPGNFDKAVVKTIKANNRMKQIYFTSITKITHTPIYTVGSDFCFAQNHSPP